MSKESVSAFPLALAQEGERVRVVRLQRGERMARRLADMGLALGSEAVMLRGSGEGPVLVAVGDARIAIGRGMASRVMVELV
jgi:ferrous iron transport protein A